MAWRITDTTVLSPSLICSYEKQLCKQREMLTLSSQPIKTVSTFLSASISFFRSCLRRILQHPVFVYFLVPVVLLWAILEFIPGPHTAAIDEMEFCVEFFVWWVGLGILSSIGLGSGLQSGVLFVFPHVIECPELTPASTPVTYFGVWRKIILVCFFQAAGTAIGEIPPYWMTRAARLTGIKAGTASANDIPQELEPTTPTSSNMPNGPRGTWYSRTVDWAKNWMVTFLKNHGFWGVLLMASFPNVAFDICGVCCGHYLMPFWTFFGATFLGKAVIRNCVQSLIFVALCSEQYLESLIKMLQKLTPDSLHVDQTIREVLEESRASFHKNHPMTKSSAPPVPQEHHLHLAAILMFWWQIVMAVILFSFLMSCISQFAQFYQLTLDNEELTVLRQKLSNQAKSAQECFASSSAKNTPVRQQNSMTPVSSDPNQKLHSLQKPNNDISLPKTDLSSLGSGMDSRHLLTPEMPRKRE